MCPGIKIALAAGALALASSAALRAERLPIRLYTINDGLPSQFVERVYRDSHGFLWFATREGLSRFDGARFLTYGLREGLPHPAINDILESRSGTYWIATNGGGVIRYESTATARTGDTGAAASRRFVTYGIGSTRLSAHVNAVYEDAAGRIWAGSDAGLYVWDGRPDVFRRVFLGLPSREDEIAVHKTLLDDGAGGLWVGTSLGLARWMADGRVVWYRPQFEGIAPPEHAVPGTSATVRAVLQDRSGKLWIGTHSGLLVHVPSKSQPGSGDPWRAAACASFRDSAGRLASMTLPETPGTVCRFAPGPGQGANWISALFQSVSGSIWIGSLDGLFRVDDGRVRVFGPQNGLADTTAGSFAEDRDENLWMATASGAVRLAAEGLVSYTGADGLDATQMRWIGEDPHGAVHVAGGNWLVGRYTEGGFRTRSLSVPQDPLPSWGSSAAVIDTRGEWWAMTRRGLFRFRNGTTAGSAARVYDHRDGLAADNTFQLFEDSSGALWISTVSPGQANLARLDRASNRIRVFANADGLTTNTTATAFAEDASGAIWIGFQYGGVARYRDGRFRMFTEEHGIPAGQITSLYVDSIGRLWIGSTNGGLGRVDDPHDDAPRVRTYTTADGLISDNVRCLVADRQGRLYVGTGKGITRLDPQTGRVRQFTTAHGLANDFVTTAFADRHGRLWFGTLRGLSRLDPSPERPPSAPIVSLAGIRVAGHPVVLPELGLSTLENLTLASAENNLQFEFFGIGESLRFRYRLAPVDQNWLGPTDQRTITYATLAPGSYRFEVEAATQNGVVSERPATVSFTIQAPLWRRRWFLALLLGVAVVVMHAAHRLRLRRALAEERIRTRIATDLHDDIGSSLSLIAILSDLAQRQAGSASESGRTLSSIAATARESVDAMSDIVWALNPKRDSFLDLTQRMRAVATNLMSARNIELSFSTDETPPEIGFDAQVRREMLLILKEALNNVVRHSGADRVSVDLRRRAGRLAMTVSDSGRGFDADEPTRGLGLTSLRRRARRLGGVLTIDSVPAQGTTLRLEVPIPRHGIFGLR